MLVCSCMVGVGGWYGGLVSCGVIYRCIDFVGFPCVCNGLRFYYCLGCFCVKLFEIKFDAFDLRLFGVLFVNFDG